MKKGNENAQRKSEVFGNVNTAVGRVRRILALVAPVALVARASRQSERQGNWSRKDAAGLWCKRLRSSLFVLRREFLLGRGFSRHGRFWFSLTVTVAFAVPCSRRLLGIRYSASRTEMHTLTRSKKIKKMYRNSSSASQT